MRLNTHTQSYADLYLSSHANANDKKYRMDYWNHFLLDSLLNKDKKTPTHLLEEGGGTCGVWNTLSFDEYTSVDISEPMTESAKELHQDYPERHFVHGDIFSQSLLPGTYSAIIANAYGIYYRPNLGALRRFHELLARDGLLFVAIDPLVRMRHYAVSPAAGLINRHIRPYTRMASESFTRLIELADLKVWTSVDYTPAPGWQRKAFILTK